MLETISQVGIAISGTLAIFLVAKKNKWGFVFGLISQPFWFITSIVNHQWGIFFLNVIYTISWILGIYEWFYKEKRQTFWHHLFSRG